MRVLLIPVLLLSTLAVAASQPAALRPQTATDLHLFAMPDGLDSLKTATPVPVAVARGYENQPFFDPDGRRLLYTANLDGKQTDIYEYDRVTRATRQLTRTPEGEYSPTIPPVQPGAPRLRREGFTAIRVEADGTQRLWQFNRAGQQPELVLPDIKPVGYHSWIDEDRLALYVLGTPATLELARVSTGVADRIASDIGRTLREVPRSGRVSFVQRTPDGAYVLQAFDPDTKFITELTTAASGSLDRDYAWMPDGRTVLMTAGTTVVAWTLGTAGWRPVLDVALHGLGQASRLAVSPNGDALVLVTEEVVK